VADRFDIDIGLTITPGYSDLVIPLWHQAHCHCLRLVRQDSAAAVHAGHETGLKSRALQSAGPCQRRTGL